MMRWAHRFAKCMSSITKTELEPLEPYRLGYDVTQNELNGSTSSTPDRAMVRFRNVRSKVADRKLIALPSKASVRLKMRWKPPRILHVGADVVDLPVNRIFKRQRYRAYREYMVDMLHENNVVPMLAVRQNIFKWALSKYHGDGQGKVGHLQFQLASGAIKKSDIPKIHVDLKRFGRLIEQCRRKHDRKREFVEWMMRRGMQVQPLLYESFLNQPIGFFGNFLNQLGHDAHLAEIKDVLTQDIELQRVHSGALSEYVENHEELEETFGSCFESWEP